MAITNHTHVNYGGAMLNEIIADLVWQLDQPNSHPVELYMPLILAIGRRLYGRDASKTQILERLASAKN